MQEDARGRQSVISKAAAQTPQREIPRDYPGALNVFGELTSIARRFRLRQLERAIDAERSVIEAHRGLLVAREAWLVARERLEPGNLEAIKEAERLKVRAERAEEALRLAETERKLETFEKRAAIEDDELEAEALEAKLRVKRAREALYGAAAAEPAPEPENFEEQLINIARSLSALEKERNELLQAAGANEAEISAVDAKISAQLRRKMTIEEKLAERG